MSHTKTDDGKICLINEEEEEDDDEGDGRGHDAWARTYADERSWESLQEDESGLLRPIDNKTFYHAHIANVFARMPLFEFRKD